MKQTGTFLALALLVAVPACGGLAAARTSPKDLEAFPKVFVDRSEVLEQPVGRPARVRTILSPCLGSPVRLDAKHPTFEVLLDTATAEDEFFLVPRAVVREILEQQVYVGTATRRGSGYALRASPSTGLAGDLLPLLHDLDGYSHGDPFDSKTGRDREENQAIVHDTAQAVATILANHASDPGAPSVASWLSNTPDWTDFRAPNPLGFDESYKDINAILSWRSELAEIVWRLADAEDFQRLRAGIVEDHEQAGHENLFQLAAELETRLARSDPRNWIPLQPRSGNRPASRDPVVVELVPPGGGAPAPGLYTLMLSRGGTPVEAQWNSVYSLGPVDPSPEFAFLVAGDVQWGCRERVARAALRFIREANELVLHPRRRIEFRKRPLQGPGLPYYESFHGEIARTPEFLVVVGDLVDCSYASANEKLDILFHKGDHYLNDYLQMWLLLVELDLPVHVVPGNHDGYRFEPLATHSTEADGLLLFRDALGPLYHSFDRGDFRFLCVNSFDLPAEFRTLHWGASRVDPSWFGTSSMPLLDRFDAFFAINVRKTNKLNWGGGIQLPQLEWLRERLGSRGALLPLMFLHHDPRGGTPQLSPDWAPGDYVWDEARHFPASGRSDARRNVHDVFADRASRRRGYAPRFSQTQQVHVGFYTPLRDRSTEVHSAQWFEQLFPPDGGGFPSWMRYQQEWHLNETLSGKLCGPHQWETLDPESLVPLDPSLQLSSPLDVLEAMVSGEVAALFAGHDNLFVREFVPENSSVFGVWGADRLDELARYDQLRQDEATRRATEDAGRALTGTEVDKIVEAARALDLKKLSKLQTLKVKRDLNVYRVADVADAESDGHGFFWVEARRNKDGVPQLTVSERDVPGREHDAVEKGW